MDSVGKVGLNQFRYPISIWRIYLPLDVDREIYIRSCFLTGTVTVINDNAEIKHRVKIGRLAIKQVEFPIDTSLLGSEVICTSTPYGGQLYVVDVFNSSQTFDGQSENEYRFTKNDQKGNSAMMSILPGKIVISVDSDEGVSEVVIDVANNNQDAQFKLNIKGSAIVDANGASISINKSEIRLTTLDDGKIYLNESEEPIPLGNKLKELLTKILDQLGQESAGPYPLLGNSRYLEMKQDLETLLSQISFVK